MRIIVDPLKCESNGMCVSEAPGFFTLTDDDELVVSPRTVTEADRAVVEAAARLCPKQAIVLVED